MAGMNQAVGNIWRDIFNVITHRNPFHPQKPTYFQILIKMWTILCIYYTFINNNG